MLYPPSDCLNITASWGKTFNSSAATTKLQGDPDVAGTGVLIGFVATGYICWIILLLHYLLVYRPDQAGFSARTNVIDREILNCFRKRTRKPSPIWSEALEKCVLLLSDQQIVTGIAVLVSGYLQLNDNFSVYHWQITIWLAWFSSVTHLGTLSVLQNYLQVHPAIRTLRLILMAAMSVMLIVAILPTGSPAWLSAPNDPVKCYFQSLTTSWNAQSLDITANARFLAMSSVVLLVAGYITRYIKFFRRSSVAARLLLRDQPGRKVKRGLDALLVANRSLGSKWSRWTIPLFYKPFLIGFIVLRATFDLIESMLWEIMWLLFALLWASLRLFTLKISIAQDNSQETGWSFGQCVATLLLIIPMIALIELCYEAWLNGGETELESLRHINGEIQASSGAISQVLPTYAQHVSSGHAASTITLNSDTTATTPRQSNIEIQESPYSNYIYQQPWFYGLVFLLLALIANCAAIVLSWAAGPVLMKYFVRAALPAIGFEIVVFCALPICIYAVIFVPIPKSTSPAEWFLQKVCRSKDEKIQKKALVALSTVLLVLFAFIMCMSFYFTGSAR